MRLLQVHGWLADGNSDKSVFGCPQQDLQQCKFFPDFHGMNQNFPNIQSLRLLSRHSFIPCNWSVSPQLSKFIQSDFAVGTFESSHLTTFNLEDSVSCL